MTCNIFVEVDEVIIVGIQNSDLKVIHIHFTTHNYTTVVLNFKPETKFSIINVLKN